MKLLFVSVLLIISETNSFYITNRTYKDENRILLRKLQNLQQNPNTAQTSWSDIFADVLVKRIFSFHKTNNETENLTSVEPPETSVWIKAVSCILKFYKNYIYDKIAEVKITISRVYENEVVTANINKDVEVITEVDVANFIPNDVEMIEPKYHGKIFDNSTDEVTKLYNDVITNDIEATSKINVANLPKDVEIIEPKYHGKLSNSSADEVTTETKDIEVTSEVNIDAVEIIDDAVIDDCKNGFQKDPDGNCVDPKSLKFILSIPPQCPTGYRRDWLGYCRGSL